MPQSDDPTPTPLALPRGGRWVRRTGAPGPRERHLWHLPLLDGMAWADAGVAPGGKATLRVYQTDLRDVPGAPPYGGTLRGRMTAVDPRRPDAFQARTVGTYPSQDEKDAWGDFGLTVTYRGEPKRITLDLRPDATAPGAVQPVLGLSWSGRRDRYVGPPIDVWPAPTFVQDPRWDAPDPDVFRPSERLDAVAVDEGTDLTVVVRVRPDDDVRAAELLVRVWAVGGGARAVMDVLPKAGWVPRVWQDVFVRVEGEGPDPFGDLRFRWRAARHAPTERAVAYLRSASPGSADAYGSGRLPVYLGWVRVNGVVRSLPPLDIVGPDVSFDATPS